MHGLLNPKHPFHATADCEAWLALKNGVPAGRILLILNNQYNKRHKSQVGFFGLFESEKDDEVAKALLERVLLFKKKYQLKEMIGPVNPSTNYECGLLVEGFNDPPCLMMPYNPPFYAQLFEDFGLKKAKDLCAFRFETSQEFDPVIEKIAYRIKEKQRVTYRPFDKKNWKKEMILLHRLYNFAWEENWGFVPMTEAEFFQMGKEMLPILTPELTLIAEVDNRPVGFILSLLDYNQVFKRISSGRLLPWGIVRLLTEKKKITRTRTLAMGIVENYRKKGIETGLYLQSLQFVKKNMPQISEAEFSWVLEDNHQMVKAVEKMGCVHYKTYRLYHLGGRED